jgi:hypothetical protein
MASDPLEAIARLSARERARIATSVREGPMEPDADKVGALGDAVRALEVIGAPHALVGGVAVGIRSGVPRATLDTDLAVRSTVEHARIVAALVAAGFSLQGEFAHSTNFRHASGEPVQIVCDPGFDAMIDRAELLEIAGLHVRVVTTEDLIAMKRRAAADPARRRSKALRDEADVALLRGDVPGPDEGW